MAQAGTVVDDAHVMNEIRAQVHVQLRPLFDPQANSIPALRATCQKILNISGDTSSPDVLAQVISRDPGLTCKVLQIANGIAYSPQHTITTVTHAVSWLGLDIVRTLVATVQLLENHSDRQPVLSRLISKALFAATHASELGGAMNYPQLGQLFSAALLYSFADMVIAYQTPDLFQSLTVAQTLEDEVKILGVSKARFAAALAQAWVLPADLVDLIGTPMPTATTKWQTDQQLFMGLVAGSNHLIEAMADSPNSAAADSFRRNLLRGTALPEQTLQDALTRAFDKGRQLSRSVGITETVIHQASAPASLSLTVSPKSKTSLPNGPPGGQAIPPVQAIPPIQTRPLETLQQFQTSLLAAKDLNSLLSILVNTLHDGGGFTRVALALLNPGDTDQLLGRVVVGVDTPDRYLASFTGSLSAEHPLFLHVLKGHDPVMLSEVSTHGLRSLSATFATTWCTSSAILAPIRIGVRPIGLLYSDRDPHLTQVSSQDLQAFQLFFGQAILSLNRLAGVL